LNAQEASVTILAFMNDSTSTPFFSRRVCRLVLPALLLGIPFSSVHATSLSLGADYLLRGVSTTERDKTIDGKDYYDQRLVGYLITDLSKDVEATVRVQSINPWGLEGSTTPLASRYPNANGNLWVQNAFVRLPNIWKDRVVLTLGRQPIVWGDGAILSDDELGFNALQAQIKSPWRRFDFDVEGFTAKINDSITGNKDTDLNGVLLGFDREIFRWEFMGLWEKNRGTQDYEMGAETSTLPTSNLDRMIYGVRLRTNVKDAYLKGEYYQQAGSFEREGGQKIKLGGDAYILGLGAKQNTARFGRFGVVAEYAYSSGDKPSTPSIDESFRPDFAARWSGLERKGYGGYFAATLSDAYSPNNPFGAASAANSGLPAGTSGLKIIKFGIESTPWSPFTLSIYFYQYTASSNLSGTKDLGSEFDYGISYRYSGLVTFRASSNIFTPGDAYEDPSQIIDNRKKASMNTFDAEVKF